MAIMKGYRGTMGDIFDNENEPTMTIEEYIKGIEDQEFWKPIWYSKEMKGNARWTENFTDRSTKLQNIPSTVSAIASSVVFEALHVTESGKLSISDAQLNSRGFVLHKSVDKLDLDELNAVFVKVGFPHRQKEKMERSLKNTPSLVWVEERKSGKLVTFARAIGDDVFNAIIWDVVVDPSFQGFGLGKAVMERVMAELLAKGIINIGLYVEPHVLGFYRTLGFVADPEGIEAMVYSRKPQKSR